MPTVVGLIRVGWALPSADADPSKTTELNLQAYGTRKVMPPWPNGATGFALTRSVAAYVVRHNGSELACDDHSMGLWLDEWTATPAVRILHAPAQFVWGDGRTCVTNPRALVMGHGSMGRKNAQRCADSVTTATTAPVAMAWTGKKRAWPPCAGNGRSTGCRVS